MNRIVCDVCGTSYPETAPQCPICGTAKTDSTKSATSNETGYAYVKGGRFSHANVRKRNAGNKELPRVVAPVKPPKEKKAAAPKPQRATVRKEQTPAKKPDAAKRRQDREKRERGTNIILAMIALLLVLAIVAVFAYIVKGFIDGRKPSETTPTTTVQQVGSTTLEIHCSGLRLALSEKKFSQVGDKFQINPLPTPAETTDPIWYESADEKIAVVDEKGIVTAVADGEVIIYVHCGEYTAECRIICEVGVEPTEPNQPGPTDPSTPVDPVVELKLNRDDFTLNGYGDSHILYTGELDRTQMIWTSSDETVATVQDGKVVAVGNGNATITAEYMGQTASCEVHCVNVIISVYELRTRYGSGNDFTISVGDTIVLYLVDKETGLRVQADQVTFTLSKEGVITIDENGKITAVSTGDVTVTVTCGGQTLKSKFHVKKAK